MPLNFLKHFVATITLAILTIFPSKSVLSKSQDLNQAIYSKNPTHTHQVKTNIIFKKGRFTQSRPSEFSLNQKEVTSNIANSRNWTHNNDSFIWNPDPQPFSTFLEIPLTQNTPDANLPNENFKEFQVAYQDLFPENPVSFRFNVTIDGKRFQTTAELPTNDPRFPGFQKKQLSKGSIKVRKSIDITSAPWKAKNLLYLAKRKLGFQYDPVWRFAIDRHYTVFQRRFHENLKDITALELAFGPEVSQAQLDQVMCNFRLSHFDPAKSPFVFEAERLQNTIIETSNGKILRIELGDLVYQYFKTRKNLFLEELIIFFPGDPKSITQSRPLKRVDFIDSKKTLKLQAYKTIDAASAQWKPKDTLYLIKRELGFDFDPAWYFHQDRDTAVFKHRLDLNLHHLASMAISLAKSVEDKHLQCRLRIGFKKGGRSEKIIHCNELTKRIYRTPSGKATIDIQLAALVRQYYSKGKKDVFLKEITIYFPGNANNYVTQNSIEKVHFFERSHKAFSNLFKKKDNIYLAKRELGLPFDRIWRYAVNEGNSVFRGLIQALKLQDENFLSPSIASSPSMATSKRATNNPNTIQPQVNSYSHKTLSFDLTKYMDLTPKSSKIKDITISIEPSNSSEKSGIRLIQARGILQRQADKYLFTKPKLNRQWGGPFLSDVEQEKIEKIYPQTYYPFNLMDSFGPFQSGKLDNKNLKINATNDAFYRIVQLKEGLACDIIFYSSNTEVSITLQDVGPYEVTRKVNLDLIKKGPINLFSGNEKLSGKQNEIDFILKRGKQPKLTIRPQKQADFSNKGEVRGRILLKSAKIFGSQVMRLSLERFKLKATINNERIILKEILPRRVGKKWGIDTFYYSEVPQQFISTKKDFQQVPAFEKINFQNFSNENLSENGVISLNRISPNTTIDQNLDLIDIIELSINPHTKHQSELTPSCSLRLVLPERFFKHKNLNCSDLLFDVTKEEDDVFNYSQKFDGGPPIAKKTKNSEVNIRGATSDINWKPVFNGIVLKGNTPWAEVDWKIKSSLPEKLYFFLNIPIGAEFIQSAQLIFSKESLTFPPIPITPNRASRINLAQTDADNLKIKLTFRPGNSFQILLKEMALFEPRSLTNKEALYLPILTKNKVFLAPIDVQSPSSFKVIKSDNDLQIFGSSSQNTPTFIKWTTRLDPEAIKPRQIHFKYSTPQTINQLDPYWLHLTGANNHFSKKIRLSASQGHIIIPVGYLTFDPTFLNTLEWKILLPKISNLPKATSNFTFSMFIDGLALKTPYDDLLSSPILKLNNQNLFISPSFDVPASLKKSEKFLVNFTVQLPKSITEKTLALKTPHHPYFDVSSVSLSSLTPISPNSFQTKETSPKPVVSQTNNIFTLVISGVGIITLIVGWLKGWKQHKPTVLITSLTQTKFINRVTGLAVSGLALILILFSDPDKPFDQRIFLLLILFSGVINYEAILYFKNRPVQLNFINFFFDTPNDRLPKGLPILTVLILVVTSFLFGATPQPTFSLICFVSLPISLIYFYLPWRNQVSKLLLPSLKEPIPWLVAAVGFYGMGLIAIVAGLHFTHLLEISSISSIFVVFGWLPIMQTMRSLIKDYMPNYFKIIYADKSTQYIAGFFSCLAFTTLFRILTLEFFAEQFAITAFYMITVGTILKFRAINQEKYKTEHGL